MDAQEAKRRKLEAKMGGGPPPSFPSAVPVRAPKAPKPEPTKQAPPAPAAAEEEADPFVCDANDAVSFRLVRTAADMATAEPFEPEFTHQVFREDETIFGFRDLRIDIFQSAHLFKTYVRVRFAEKVKSTLNPADDVIEALRAHFGEEMMTDEKAFLETLEADERALVVGRVRLADVRVPKTRLGVFFSASACAAADSLRARSAARARAAVESSRGAPPGDGAGTREEGSA